MDLYVHDVYTQHTHTHKIRYWRIEVEVLSSPLLCCRRHLNYSVTHSFPTVWSALANPPPVSYTYSYRLYVLVVGIQNTAVSQTALFSKGYNPSVAFIFVNALLASSMLLLWLCRGHLLENTYAAEHYL